MSVEAEQTCVRCEGPMSHNATSTVCYWCRANITTKAKDMIAESIAMIEPQSSRPSWDTYWMQMATLVATRATCDRKHVGAVIVKDRRIVATGYNGSPAGLPHCDDVGHLMVEIDGRPSCVRTLHSESNALDQAGRAACGATLYVTVTPCYDCAKRILNAGIVRVLYGEHYESRNTGLVMELFGVAGVQLSRWGT